MILKKSRIWTKLLDIAIIFYALPQALPNGCCPKLSSVADMFAALYLSLGADYLPFMLRANRRKGDSRLDEWAVNLRSAALVLASSQIAIIGFLNLLPLEKFRPFISRSLAYAMVVLFTILSYRFLAFADSEMQLGGG